MAQVLDEEFATVQNYLSHGVATEAGRQALDRIESRLSEALAEVEVLTERVGMLSPSVLARRVDQLEAQVGFAREMAERLSHVLREL